MRSGYRSGVCGADRGTMNGNLDIRRLSRSRSERVFAGVCGGVAEFCSVDPNIVRLVFAIASFFGGAGVVVYAVAWAVMPEAGRSQSIAQRWVSRYQNSGPPPGARPEG